MIEFDSVCYLQNHKTGCSFVEAFLRKFCVEGIRRYEKHSPLRKARNGVFYFISIREPLDAYGSLFRYGMDGKGEVFMRLKAAGQEQLYARGIAGFSAWLAYVLDVQHAPMLMHAAPPTLWTSMGLQSWRYLRLAVPSITASANSMRTRDSIRASAAANSIIHRVIRYERMKEDLRELVQGPLSHVFDDPVRAIEWIDSAPPINASKTTGSAELLSVEPSLVAQLHDREWLLYDAFYGPPAQHMSSSRPALRG